MAFSNLREVTQDHVLLDYAYAELLEAHRNGSAALLRAQLDQIGGWSSLTKLVGIAA